MLESKRILSLISNRFLELIILPTEQCNFRCTYCYEDFSIGKMKTPTINGIKNLITKRMPDLDVLKLSWFGGEPLSAKDIIYDISSHVQALRQQYSQVNYLGGITTNAFQLHESVLEKLVNHGVKTFQVSLDGTEEVHNKTRRRIDGSGSFREIWRNLIAARDSHLDFSMVLRLHVTPENVLDIYALIEIIKESFGFDQRFSIFFKAIENLGGNNSGSFKVLYGKTKSEILAKLNELVAGVMEIQDLPEAGPYVCYAAQMNSFLIRADGRIGKCTVAFNDERNAIGEILEDGSLNIAATKFNLWTRGIKSQNLSELNCPMHNMPRAKTGLQAIAVRVES